MIVWKERDQLAGAALGFGLMWRDLDAGAGVRLDRRGITTLRRGSERTIAWNLIRTVHAGARDVHTRYGYAGTVVTIRLLDASSARGAQAGATLRCRRRSSRCARPSGVRAGYALHCSA